VEGSTPAKAAIHHLSGYSAHADQQILCDWVKSMPEPPGEVRLVHGEPEAQKALTSKLDTLF
jgi:metallo-beta-lactamase family protein